MNTKMTNTKTNNVFEKDYIWIGLFTIFPFILLGKSSELFGQEGVLNIVISILLGSLGLIIGYLLYSFVKTKSTKIKTLSLVIFVFVLTGFVRITYLNSLPKLLTCEICGYKAVLIESTECDHCGTKTWLVDKDKFNNKEVWLKEKQLDWFYLFDENELNYGRPKVDEGFEKDIKWKPVITKKEIREYMKE